MRPDVTRIFYECAKNVPFLVSALQLQRLKQFVCFESWWYYQLWTLFHWVGSTLRLKKATSNFFSFRFIQKGAHQLGHAICIDWNLEIFRERTHFYSFPDVFLFRCLAVRGQWAVSNRTQMFAKRLLSCATQILHIDLLKPKNVIKKWVSSVCSLLSQKPTAHKHNEWNCFESKRTERKPN